MMDIDLGEKVKPSFPKEQFDWFVRNGITSFLKLVGKVPAGKERRKLTGELSSISKHVQNGFNIGIQPPPGVVIVDVDLKKDGFASLDRLLVHAFVRDERPSIDDLIKSTFTVRSGGGGLHLYFRYDLSKAPRGSIRGFPGIDLKTSNNQHVVAPGSVHPVTGRVYTIENWPDELGDLPEPLAPYVLRQIRNPLDTGDRSSSAHSLWGVVQPNEIAALLDVLDPRDFRSYVGDDASWINLLAAVHHASGGAPEAMAVFADWSARDKDYEAEAHKAVEHRWGTFRDRRDGSQVATVNSLLRSAKQACADAAVLGLANDKHNKALATARAIPNRLAAAELEPLEDTEAGNLLAWLSSPDGETIATDSEALAAVIAKASEQSDLAWPELSVAISARLDGRLSPLKVQRLFQKAVTKREKEERGSKLTYAEVVALITQDALETLADDKGDLAIPPSKQIFKYERGRWQELADNALTVAAWESSKKIANLQTKAQKSLNKYAVDAADCAFMEASITSTALYDNEKMQSCINLENGTLWFNEDGTYELRPHNRDDMLTVRFDYAYDENATCPACDTMLNQVTDHLVKKYSEQERDEYLDHQWELFGYAIQPLKPHPAYYFWIGSGHNGKSKISEILINLVGRKRVLAKGIEKIFNPQNNHGEAGLEGKLLVITDDLNSGVTIKDGDLKNISKNTQLDINPKNKPEKRIMVQTTPLIISNKTPSIVDTSEGFARRLYPWYFDKNIAHLQNSPLPKLAEKELPGILNRAVRGYSRMLRRGHFGLPRIARDFRARFLNTASPILGFWESLEKTPIDAHMESTADLYDKYRAYVVSEGAGKPQSKVDFINALNSQKIEADSTFVYGWSIGPVNSGLNYKR